MIGTILLIVAFQVYWLTTLYREEEQSMRKTVDVVFRESMYKLQAERFKNDTSIFFKSLPDENIFLGDVASAVKISLDDSNTKAGPPRRGGTMVIRSDRSDSAMHHFNYNVQLSKTDSSHRKPAIIVGGFSKSAIALGQKITPEQIDSLIKHRKIVPAKPGPEIELTNGVRVYRRDMALPSADIQLRAQAGSKNGNGSMVRKIMLSSKVLNDTISLNKIDSLYTVDLSKAGITVGFSIRKDTFLRRKKDTFLLSKDIITSQIPVGFANPVAYRAQFSNPATFILKKIAPQMVLSLALVAITFFSFASLYRNLVAQRKLGEIKNEFISNITHELKTPIATVSVAIEALRNFGGIQSPERTKEYLDISASELQRLGLLVDKVLKLSMFENKEIELKKEIFDWKQLTEEVMNTMKLQFDKHKAQTSFKTIGEGFLIDADKLHITSVVYNLLDNALKYSKESPQIEVALVAHPQYIELDVTDNGIGIPHEYKEKIFEKFFRIPTGDRHNTKGYGLGLSYVSHVVKRHNGFISVQSELGKGSTFTVKIPRA